MSVNRRQFVKRSSLASAGFLAPAFVPSQAISAKNAKPAILGGEKSVKEKLPEWPMIETIDEENFIDALRRKKWCRLGAKITNAFEADWAKLNGAKFTTATVNGTNSLYAALNALEIGPGDEVIVPPYTFVATVNAVLQQYALPVFSDSDINTFQMDIASIEAKITPDTKAIMPVHMGGSMADMDAVMAIAKKHNLAVIEDACQAHYAEWDGQKAGSIGDVGCFSFQATKILACGEGGACITSRKDLHDAMQSFANNGRDRKQGSKGYLHQGSNLRMTEYQSALLFAQLTRFEDQCNERVRNAALLDKLMEEIPGVRPAAVYPKNNRNTHYLYMVDYDKREYSGLSLSKFTETLRKEGVYCYGGYSYLNKHPFLEKTLNSRWYKRIYSDERLKTWWDENECPKNDQLSETTFFITQNNLIGGTEMIEQIAQAFQKIHAHAKDIA